MHFTAISKQVFVFQQWVTLSYKPMYISVWSIRCHPHTGCSFRAMSSSYKYVMFILVRRDYYQPHQDCCFHTISCPICKPCLYLSDVITVILIQSADLQKICNEYLYVAWICELWLTSFAEKMLILSNSWRLLIVIFVLWWCVVTVLLIQRVVCEPWLAVTYNPTDISVSHSHTVCFPFALL